MYGKHFLSLADYSSDEIKEIISVAFRIKAEHAKGKEHTYLKGKTLAMVFQKPSTRTRVSFEVGTYQLGGKPLIVRPDEIELGKREAIPDVSRVLSRYVDGVMMRVIRHREIKEFALASDVPVINGLSDRYHPCQAVADLLTIAEKHGVTQDSGLDKIKGLKICYVGDGNNVCNSLIIMAKLVGLNIAVSCPSGYQPTISQSEGEYELISDPNLAVADADVVYTDVWTSMGQEDQELKRLRAFDGYTVTEDLLDKAGSDVIFMHCLPAHRGEEVDDYVVDSPRSVVFDQAENRLHAQKAILRLLMSK